MIKAEILLYDKLPPLLSCPDNDYIKTHISKIKNPDYKSGSLLAYMLFSHMISDFFNIDISDITIAENEFGKPLITSHANLHFNVSHTSKAVCSVISDFRVGIDIEQTGKIRASLANKCFTENELRELNSPTDFYRLWTLKEAYLKMLGSGINRSLKEIEFSHSDPVTCRDCGTTVPFKFYAGTVDDICLAIASQEVFSSSDLIIKHI